MRIIGLTGGIGSGKSTVSAMLRELGATIVDADEGARAVVEPGQPALEEIVAEFGADVLDAEGRLNREKVADRAFTDPKVLDRLNAITHPRVREWMAERIQEAAGGGAQVVVLDVPLLFESKLDGGLEWIVVVWSPPETQLARAVGRGVRYEDARARIEVQMPLAEKRERATRVIDNSGSLEDTRRQVESLWRELTSPG